MKKQILSLNSLEQDDRQADQFMDDLEGRCSDSNRPEWTKEFSASGGGKSTTTVPPAPVDKLS